MKHGQFIFTDLSTYDVPTSQHFYKEVLGWEYASDDGAYFLAFAGKNEAAGMYETPQKFQEMNMPHFWMTYIQVKNRDETVKIAKKLGAIIEVTEDSAFGKVALIRDPLGAGFTVYEGNKLHTRTKKTPGTLVWNELWVSDVDAVKDFYQMLFDWKYEEDAEKQRLNIIVDGENVGAIQQMEKDKRGKWEYWNSFFATTDKQRSLQAVKKNGGTILVDDAQYTSCLDHSGSAFFFLVEVEPEIKNTKNTEKNGTLFSQIPLKALASLVVIWICLLLSWNWIFGLMFLVFTIQDIRNGSTFVFESVNKKSHPVMFWMIVLTWILLSIVGIFYVY